MIATTPSKSRLATSSRKFKPFLRLKFLLLFYKFDAINQKISHYIYKLAPLKSAAIKSNLTPLQESKFAKFIAQNLE
ncbi:hypothetical protein CSUNSWCD_256 [Campylobacter showae CSUNSWCD]|uniref:Uncharacterized protein n=1 Tax=Campylobacter showae CSUNSWCD TaxID=1244083 RepID=M5ISA6_9BACT|nr:hypothetical protein CSUNSWCD_256 [Campylobacter showae CSUNSWCD]